MVNMRKNIHLYNLIAIFILCSIFLTSCNEPVKEVPLVVVDTLEDEVTYNLVETNVGEVVLTKNLSCSYVQTKEQEVVFPVGGKIVEKVYVKNGDQVKVGDILVELQIGNIKEDIVTLEYQISRNKLLLSYLDKAEEFDLQSSYYSLVYDTKMEEDDVKNKDKRDEKISEDYTYQREDYEDNIEFDTLKLNELKNELNSSSVHATLSGKVMDIKKNLEGSTAKRGEVIMKIVDNENGIFETQDQEASAYFKEGQNITMTIVYGEAKGEYILTPYNMSEWKDTQKFSIIEGPENVSALEVGTTGTIIAPIDLRENVLRIPNSALYEADGRYYTYVLDENKMRKAQFIEVGLIGDNYTEILSGITEGVKVVKR